ncbi:hypothetical protein [uncultured Tateyamaria sp.]|uniref:hypothetical protein n=1 Tax=Tateyamaria sp. 1078 TaxID=3417464 RepID=UPI00261836EE|nr:hypothetical protein [uncultured Tateyamaria sp.]
MPEPQYTPTEYQRAILSDLYDLMHTVPKEQRVRPLTERRLIADRLNLHKYLVNWFAKHPSVQAKYHNDEKDFLPNKSDFDRLRKHFNGSGGNLTARLLYPDVIEAFREFIEGNHDPQSKLRKKYRDLAQADELAKSSVTAKLGKGRVDAPRRTQNPKPVEDLDHSFHENEYVTRAELKRALESFLETADRILLFPPFSWRALSIHFCFAAFYAFLAMALVWGLSSILDLGEVSLLPSGSEAATTGRDFAGEEVSDNRFFVLSAVMVVVLVVVVGLIAAYTSVTSTFVQSLGDWIRARTDQLAVGAVIISSVALGLSGMDVRFAVLFCAIMLVAVLLAGRWDRRRLLAFSFPFAFIFSIICVAALGTIWGPMFAAGGVLPVLAFMSLLIGAAAQSKDEDGTPIPSKDGTLISAGVVLVCSLLLAGLNYYVFDGWFRIDPWDPGTVVVLLILPVANGIWDYFSASITRRLSQWALDVTETMEDHKAVLAYIGFVLVDVILAFGTIILLYLCLFSLLNGYNMVAFPDSEGVSLNAFFSGFQESLFSASGLLVVIMLVTVLVPTLIHVHMVSRSMLRVGGLVGNLSALGYLFAMLGCLALLLNAARGILYFLVPAVPV